MCLKIMTLKKVSFASLAFEQAQECGAILACVWWQDCPYLTTDEFFKSAWLGT